MTPLPTTAPNTISGVVDVAEGWEITGWVGTVDEQKSIDEETNVAPVLAWGKLIHEDLLSAVKPAGVFAKYLIVFAKYLMGELHADFVDQDGLDDIATSDHQSLKETDQCYEALRKTLEDVLRTVGNSWRDWRRDDALDKARKNPVVEEWYSSLKGDAKKFAKQLFGKIGDIPIAKESERSSSGTATRSCPGPARAARAEHPGLHTVIKRRRLGPSSKTDRRQVDLVGSGR